MAHTYTRTHVVTDFADPFLTCDHCGKFVTGWHNNDTCGCDASCWNEPCGHTAGVTSVCPSWSPVDGCTCAAQFGSVDHGTPETDQ